MFSDMLAERRRQLGYSISQASRVLRLREDVIIAFEEGDFERMPKSGYAQGMLSSYARYLSLDANMVVDAYVQDFERYKREGRRRGAGGRGGSGAYAQRPHVQPHVPSRGLLPTSGGPAGDMGSFATTRVRTRGSSSSVEHTDTVADYTQVRPYTELNPSNRYAKEDERPARTSSGRIETNTVQNRETSRRGTPSNRSSSYDRPRRSGSPSRNSSRRSGQRKRRTKRSVFSFLPPQLFVALGLVLVIGLAFFVVLQVGSCVRHEPSSTHTIPVTSSDEPAAKTESEATEEETTTKTTTTTTSTTQKDVKESTKEDESATQSTSVAVSVTDGSVTWLEIECDGSSKVAETITGPWHHTYTVEESITIQAGNTSAVSVVQDGSQLQFESMASGIGTIRIEVPNAAKKSKTSVTKSTTDEDETSNTDDDSNAYSDTEQDDYSSDDGSYGYDSYNDESYDEESYGYDQY